MNSEQLNALPPAELFAELVRGEDLHALLAVARAEDMGAAGDVTSELCVPADLSGQAVVRSRAAGRLAGAALLQPIAQVYDAALQVEILQQDGETLEAGTEIARIAGPLRSILSAERVMLNFLTHLSGIASLTARFVHAVADTKARIYDTRKTVPGLRHLAKYAVRCGGGFCHRIGLYDAVLIKDNHLTAFAGQPLDAALRQALAGVSQLSPQPSFVEVEVDTLDQLEQVLRVAGLHIVLLDNMDVLELRQAVAMRDQIAPTVQLEASGGVMLGTLHTLASTGVDRIAVGALTHSAPALDIGLDIPSPH
ncbi:MAG: carboxylating nicotinate-nucleotide diphosphorylase [Phycisphaeraceae bacterium]